MIEKRNKTFMRIDKDLLEEIKKCKLVKEESYASVVKRMINKERKLKK
jgi:hypothetical protein